MLAVSPKANQGTEGLSRFAFCFFPQQLAQQFNVNFFGVLKMLGQFVQG